MSDQPELPKKAANTAHTGELSNVEFTDDMYKFGSKAPNFKSTWAPMHDDKFPNGKDGVRVDLDATGDVKSITFNTTTMYDKDKPESEIVTNELKQDMLRGNKDDIVRDLAQIKEYLPEQAGDIRTQAKKQVGEDFAKLVANSNASPGEVQRFVQNLQNLPDEDKKDMPAVLNAALSAANQQDAVKLASDANGLTSVQYKGKELLAPASTTGPAQPAPEAGSTETEQKATREKAEKEKKLRDAYEEQQKKDIFNKQLAPGVRLGKGYVDVVEQMHHEWHAKKDWEKIKAEATRLRDLNGTGDILKQHQRLNTRSEADQTKELQDRMAAYDKKRVEEAAKPAKGT